MLLTPELRDKVTNELDQFSVALNLSDVQKERLQEFLSNAYEKMQEYKQQNPWASKEDVIRKITENRDSIRQRFATFLTPEQLTKWDSEVVKVLSQKAASA